MIELVLCMESAFLGEEKFRIVTRVPVSGASCVGAPNGTECFVLKKMDDKQVNLEIDFLTGEWRGYISPQI